MRQGTVENKGSLSCKSIREEREEEIESIAGPFERFMSLY